MALGYFAGATNQDNPEFIELNKFLSNICIIGSYRKKAVPM